MEIKLCEQGKALLRSEDNIEWIDKITCWVSEEAEYNIYIFQVIVDDQLELENYYETITASIATDFQSNLDKAIERWNIYLVFECAKSVGWSVKLKVEQDKFAVRKVVWDNLKKDELGDKEYIRKRLLSLEINVKPEKHHSREEMLNKLAEKDKKLYKILNKNNLNIDQKVALYIGDQL